MGRDLENLSNELVQAQLLLCGKDQQIGQLLREISRLKLQDGVSDGSIEPSAIRNSDVSQKEAMIRNMLERLEKLG
ncbi:MAG: hypothetical protein EXR08_00880 [Alphaproteobacteria bacterium]|nr:hypothetical protein [Alphaproteobacteria bacterium]